jgi:hypothetical protein
MKKAKDYYGTLVYTNDINTLVVFAIIVFILIVVSELINFIIIKWKVVNKLQITKENYQFIEKFCKPNDIKDKCQLQEFNQYRF